jgi:hypothetical protein
VTPEGQERSTMRRPLPSGSGRSLEQRWIGQYHGRRGIADPGRNDGGAVGISLMVAFVGKRGDCLRAMQRPVGLWL